MGAPITIQVGALEPINPGISMTSTTAPKQQQQQQQQKQQQDAAGAGQKAGADAAPKAPATAGAASGIGSISWQGLWSSSTAPAVSFGSNYLLGQYEGSHGHDYID